MKAIQEETKTKIDISTAVSSTTYPRTNPIAYPVKYITRKIAYYSDFDIDANDWKSEQQSICIYARTLLDGLSKSY